MKHLILRCALLALAASLLLPLAAHAQSPTGKEALQLFEHGKKLLKEGNAKQACAALKQSLDLEEAINTYYQLGRCYEDQDRYLEAHDSYLRASTMARTNDDEKRAGIAQKRADDLKPKIPTVVVVVPPDAKVPGLTITRNDEAVPEADWGKAVPVDPGDHTIKAAASGYQEWSSTVRASRTGGANKVAIPKLTPGAGAMAPPPPPPPGEDAPEGATERRSTGMFVTGIVLIPVGGLAILGAAAAGIAAAAGDVGGLDATTSELEVAAIGLGIFGVAALGAGIPLLIIGNQKVPVEGSSQPPPPEAALHVGPTSASFRMTFH
jgi:hypothetical protein